MNQRIGRSALAGFSCALVAMGTASADELTCPAGQVASWEDTMDGSGSGGQPVGGQASLTAAYNAANQAAVDDLALLQTSNFNACKAEHPNATLVKGQPRREATGPIDAKNKGLCVFNENPNYWHCGLIIEKDVLCCVPEPAEGCTDPVADNYDPAAEMDDGTCEYSGCTDSSATNYDPMATNDDGSCTYPSEGCTDSAADNYDPAAEMDNGTCEYSGCTDPAATNYDPMATNDDGSCDYGGYGGGY